MRYVNSHAEDDALALAIALRAGEVTVAAKIS
jgi:hypothetical protein